MALGPRDLASLVLLTGWDATELEKFKLQDGTTFAAIVAQLRVALAGLSTELQNDPLWAGLMNFDDQPDLEYRIGVSNGFSDFTEYGRPDAKRAETEGHMLPIKDYDRALGWTWKYLKNARMSQVQADIADAIKDARDLWRQKVLTRVLKRGDDSGVALGLGSSGYSPGFATAAASTSVDFTPPANEGTTFDSDHEHYVGIAGGAFTNAVFQDMFDELREHGHEPPFECIVGEAHRTEILGLSDSVPVGDADVRYGAMQDLAAVGDEYFAVNNKFRIKEVRGMPQYYGFGYKSYGPRSQRNPLRCRLAKGATNLLVQAFPDPRSGAGAVYPLQYMTLYMEFGIGVADRTAGTPRYVNNTTWADGTPT